MRKDVDYAFGCVRRMFPPWSAGAEWATRGMKNPRQPKDGERGAPRGSFKFRVQKASVQVSLKLRCEQETL